MLLETIDVLWTARYDYEPGWVVNLHSHQFFQVVYLIDGEGTLTLDETPYALGGSHILLVAPGVKHGLVADSRVRTLDIKFRVHDRALARLLRGITPPYRSANAGVRVLFERIWQEGTRREPWHRQMCAVYLLELLLLVRRSCETLTTVKALPGAEMEATDGVTAAVTSFVREHVAEPLTVRKLAGELGCSERSIRHHFHDTLGISPLQYVTRFRIDQAMDLIRDLDCPLKEAASNVGFRNVHHFTRVFHRVTGMSPGAWREAHVHGIRKDINVDPKFRNESQIEGRPAVQRASA
jgi:AraC-like DNA-binding protein